MSQCCYLPSVTPLASTSQDPQGVGQTWHGGVQLSQPPVTLARFHVLQEEIPPWRKLKLPEQ